MKKFEGILFCTDLDGTLLKKDKTVSRENREAIEYFKSEGGLFTFITGRMAYYSRDAYDMVKPNAPIGSGNGCAIYDYEKEEYLYTSPVSLEIHNILDDIEREFPEATLLLQGFDTGAFNHDAPEARYFCKLTNHPLYIKNHREYEDIIAKILFIFADPTLLEKVQKFTLSHPLSHHFDFIRSEKSLFEILPKGLSKGTLLLKMAELFGIDKRKTVAIGDFNNDISMIKAAGVGVAVGNACDDAKAAADIVTVTNEEHAIARIIQDIDDKKIRF